MSEHTPGPWTCEQPECPDEPAWVASDRLGPFASVWQFESRDANARLIAKAPEMFALLREFGGHGGDGFCETCGRDVGSGAEHAPSCRINMILRYVEGGI